MPAIIIPDRWDKKPSGIPFIDWSNPITTGLRYFVLLDAARFNINLVTQALLGGVLEPGVVLSKESITTAATALGKLQLDISKSSWVGTYAVSSIHLSGTVDWMFASNTVWDGLYIDGTNVKLTSNLGFGGIVAPVGEKKNTRFSRVCVAIPSANDFRSISGTGPVSVDTSAALPIGAMTKVFFGSDYSGANHAAAEVEYFAIWDRVLPDAEMRAFNAAPYQVVKKPSRILYFPSAGGGGATGTGAPAAQSATVAGTATRTVTGSGAPAAQAATASGTAEREITSSGTPAAQSATVSGTGTVGAVVTGSGSPQAQSATVAGTAERTVTASGTVAAQSATVAGTAEREITSSGTPTAQSATVVGAGQVGNIITGSGAPTAQSATVAGTAEREVTSSGSPSAQSATVAGTAVRTITGSGSPQAQSATVYGYDSAPDVPSNTGGGGIGRVYSSKKLRKEVDEWLEKQQEAERQKILARIQIEDEELLVIMLALAA